MIFFFFNDTATTAIYTLSLHDALPIWRKPLLSSLRQKGFPAQSLWRGHGRSVAMKSPARRRKAREDRKSTRLSSSHSQISYAVFCLKKKKKKETTKHRGKHQSLDITKI